MIYHRFSCYTALILQSTDTLAHSHAFIFIFHAITVHFGWKLQQLWDTVCIRLVYFSLFKLRLNASDCINQMIFSSSPQAKIKQNGYTYYLEMEEDSKHAAACSVTTHGNVMDCPLLIPFIMLLFCAIYLPVLSLFVCFFSFLLLLLASLEWRNRFHYAHSTLFLLCFNSLSNSVWKSYSCNSFYRPM